MAWGCLLSFASMLGFVLPFPARGSEEGGRAVWEWRGVSANGFEFQANLRERKRERGRGSERGRGAERRFQELLVSVDLPSCFC